MSHEQAEHAHVTGASAPPYLAAPDVFPTGNPYVDHGTGCDPKDPVHADVWQHYVDEHCFLAPSQRQRLVGTYQLRVIAAEDAYKHALGELRVEELLKENPTESSWMFDLFLDVIGLVVTSSLSNALKLLRSKQADLSAITTDSAEAAAQLDKASDKQLDSIVRQAVTTGKRVAPKPPQRANDTKTENVSFLDWLTNRASMTYQQLREGALAGITDAQLLVLHEGFSAAHGHTIGEYKQQLGDKLKRYDDSRVAKVGISNNEELDLRGPPFADDLHSHAELETKAVWVTLPMGKRLALYRRGHKELPKAGERVYPGPAYHVASREEAEELTKSDLESRPFEFDRYVPDEFVELALKTHGARWQESPGSHAAGPLEMMAATWVSP